MKVIVYRSLQNKDKKNLAAMVHVHGGGVFSSPLNYKHYLSRIASKTDIVFFSIDYRLGPETKVPGQQLDVIAALKYIEKNDQSLGVDKNQISIFSSLVGCNFAIGAAILLGRENN